MSLFARAYVGIGGNLGDRLATLRAAVASLHRNPPPTTRLVAASPLYETRPIGPSTGRFLNGVIELRTELAPTPLLEHLLALEVQHGRQRRKRWDARTVDLDLLVYQRSDGAQGFEPPLRSTEGVQLPHPEMSRRDFVLQPLTDLAGPDFVIDGTSLRTLLAQLPEPARTLERRLADPVWVAPSPAAARA